MLLRRDGPAYSIEETSVEDYINEIYVKACFVRNWSVVRRGASLLGKGVASMAPSVTSMLVSGKQVRFLPPRQVFPPKKKEKKRKIPKFLKCVDRLEVVRSLVMKIEDCYLCRCEYFMCPFPLPLQVILGPFGGESHVINEPLTTGAIKDIIYSMCMSFDPREVSLQQEVVVYLGSIVTTKPMLFKGMHKISVG